MDIKTEKALQLDEPSPLFSHLEELRKRLVYSFISIAICCLAVYPFIDIILEDIAKPVGQLIFISPLEAFWSRVKLTFFLGIFISMPVILFQVWSFVQKGLLPKEKKTVFPIAFVSFVLFAVGGSFCYFLVLPVGVKFLLAYGSEVLVPMITVSRYLSFAFSLVFSFGIIFELPLVVGFLVKTGVLKARSLTQNRRIAVVAIFIAAAALTPGPDIFSQLLMAVPLLILYEAGVIIAKIIERRK